MNDQVQLSTQSQEVAAGTTARVRTRRWQPLDRSISTRQAQSWGWFPVLSVIGAVGLLLVAVANTLSRSGHPQYEFLLWAGVLMLMLPVTIRLASTAPTWRERLSLVMLVIVCLYLIKVIHSPNEFTFSDELIHQYNTDRILNSGTLYNANTLLPVTPFYPGLETVTAALASLSGLSVFASGLIIIGVARIILGLALFLFYEEVSGSARIASLGALLYTTNANFLYWSAQYSYESLALPLAVGVLFLAVRLTRTSARAERIGLTLIIMVGITIIVMTHHLTSYFVAAFFIVWALVNVFLRFKSNQPGTGTRSIFAPAMLAAFSTIMTLVWLVSVAGYTTEYLSPVLGSAVNSMAHIISGTSTTRQLFQSKGGYVAPLWERITGLGSVLLMLLGLPFGLRSARQRYRGHPIVLLLIAASLLYFAMLGLRLSPEAWETGNRASEFLFLGLAFVLALAIIELWDTVRRVRFSRVAVVVAVATLFVGGVIAGWSPTIRLGRPLQVAVGNVTIKPQGYAAANWMKQTFGPGHPIATDQSNARLLLAYGDQSPYAGGYPDINDLLGMPDFPAWQAQLMQEYDLQYLVVDRRSISSNNMEGYYFNSTSGDSFGSSNLLEPKIYEKFDRIKNIDRIYDSGNIVIYDAKAILHATPAQ